MRSPINWAVLGLLIERPGHAYELFQRFDSAYAGAIELSSNSQINGALKALRERALIERAAGRGGERRPVSLRQASLPADRRGPLRLRGADDGVVTA